jgi:hypothetical protein
MPSKSLGNRWRAISASEAEHIRRRCSAFGADAAPRVLIETAAAGPKGLFEDCEVRLATTSRNLRHVTIKAIQRHEVAKNIVNRPSPEQAGSPKSIAEEAAATALAYKPPCGKLPSEVPRTPRKEFARKLCVTISRAAAL